MHTFQHRNDKTPDKAVKMYEPTILQFIPLKTCTICMWKWMRYLNLIHNI